MNNVSLVNLQLGEGQQQTTDVTFSLADWSDEMDQSGAFVDTAALTQLDLVITCDTAVGVFEEMARDVRHLAQQRNRTSEP